MTSMDDIEKRLLVLERPARELAALQSGMRTAVLIMMELDQVTMHRIVDGTHEQCHIPISLTERVNAFLARWSEPYFKKELGRRDDDEEQY
jgi:hypothetical protein